MQKIPLTIRNESDIFKSSKESKNNKGKEREIIMTEIVKLQDCSIVDIQTDMDCLSAGCKTCGYGSDYCTTVKVAIFNGEDKDYRNKYTYLEAEYHESYNFSEEFSIGYFIRLFAKNYEKITTFTKKEFIDWYKDVLKKDFEEIVLNF